MNIIFDVFSHPFFSVVGGISSLVVIFCVLYGIFAAFTGLWPVWIRLGKNLVNRKIAVFADERYKEER